MPLLGSGVLAIWNNVTPGFEAEFTNWHCREHIPERVGVPGFLRGRRYVGLDAEPKFFNFYETETPAVLFSAAYHQRLNAPSPWTKTVVAEFKDTSRTACTVAVSLSVGTGAWVATTQLRPKPGTDRDEFVAQLAPLLAAASQAPGITGIHLLEGEHAVSKVDTAEKHLRGAPDKLADWVLLTEAVGRSPLEHLRAGPLDDAALTGRGADGGAVSGIYQLDFSLGQADLARAERSQP